MYRHPMRTNRNLGQTRLKNSAKWRSIGKTFPPTKYGRSAENQPINLRLASNGQPGKDQPAHAVTKQKNWFTRLLLCDVFEEYLDIVQEFVERIDPCSRTVRFAVAAQIHAIDGISLTIQIGGQPGVTAAVFVHAVDNEHRSAAIRFRQPTLPIKFQTVAAKEVIFKMRHYFMVFNKLATLVS